MSKYKVLESVGGRVEVANSYDDLDIHHPTSNRKGLETGLLRNFESGRHHARVDGEFEEIRRTSDGRTLVKKDFVLTQDKSGPVYIPSPLEGYVRYNDKYGVAEIYDGMEKDAKLLGKVLHMKPSTFTHKDHEYIRYGEPLGMQWEAGADGKAHKGDKIGVHAHVELEVGQFKRYMRDIDSGVITPDNYPGKSRTGGEPAIPERMSSRPLAATDGVLEQGERGPEIKHLQQTLTHLGYRDAQGRLLKTDGDFGDRTKQALQAFQRDHDIDPLGIVGPKTKAALHTAEQQLLTHPQHQHHGLFRNAMEKVHGAEFQRRIAPGQHSENLAAALTVEALREGLTRIDRVEFNDRGTLARAVQVHPLRDEPGLNRNTDGIGTQQAATRSILESSQQAQQVAHAGLLPQAELQRAPVRSAVLP